jgi:hypothetical protein
VLVYRCGLDVSSRSLTYLATRLREHRRRIGSRWRRLSVGRQALLVLAHLRNGTTYAQLAAGFGIGTSTVYRYISEAVDLLAALAPTLDEAVQAASTKAYVLLDGTLLPIDRIAAAHRPDRCRPALLLRQAQETRHERAGHRRPVRPAAVGLAGTARAVHDVRAAREHGIIDALDQAHITCWADKGYQGARGTIRVPFRGRWEALSAGQQAVNRSQAKIRALVEQAMATLESWRLLRKLRCSTTRITGLVQAVLTLHHASSTAG